MTAPRLGLPSGVVNPLRTSSGVSLERAHLIGVGGAGMSAIARILADRGLQVSGSDAKGSHVMTGLARRGVRTAIGQRAENLDLLPGGPTAVVVSTAIRPTNPEVVAAHSRSIPVVPRAEALAALMAGFRGVCVAGTHGKTSTTSMLTVALQRAGLDPSFAIGGELNESGSGAHQGTGDVFVAEADESDGSFLAFSPHGAVITNIEADHLDHHGTPQAYARVFEEFVDRIGPAGFLVACVDDPGVRALLDQVRSRPGAPRIVGYGFDPRAGGGAGERDVRITRHSAAAFGTVAALALPGGSTVQLTLPVPGRHMLSNAAGALAVGLELGLSADRMADGLAGYTGVRRRFEYKGRVGGVSVFDDYAHHPTEVAAQLAAARSVVSGAAAAAGGATPGDSGGRLVVVFQPHLYSRTEMFAAQFGTALAAADLVVVLDVYGAREDPRPGISGALIVDAVPAGPQVLYLPSIAAAPAEIARLLRGGDLLITMGAGDVTMLGPLILEELGRLGEPS